MTVITPSKRFVNLGTARTMLPGPDGHPVCVHPFAESLNPRTCRADATYVLEGEFWSRYATGVHSQLRPFPRPSQYGLVSFPAMAARREDGSFVDLDGDLLDGASGGQHVQASPGKRRLAGDVITPEGKIRKTMPNGEIVLLDDTPENRNMVHSETAGLETERNPTIKGGIEKWLADMNITSFREFAALSDAVLLKIPGVTAHNLSAIRANIGDVFRRMDDMEQPDETPVGESADSAAVRTTDDPLGGVLDDDYDDEEEEPTPKRKAKKKAKKKVAKKTTAKKATKKKAAKKKTTRRKASD